MTTKNLNICLFPMELKWNDVEANLKQLVEAFQTLHPQTDLVVLPETFVTGFPSKSSIKKSIDVAKETKELVLSKLKYLARQYNVALAGSLIVESDGKIHNRAFFIEPTGDDYYADKKHLFSMAGEDENFTAGHKRMKVRFRGWNIAMVVCYDIRFPVWCRNKMNEYDLLLVVANWPEVRIDAWNKLLPARAIENEAYIAAVNCRGRDDNDFFYDGSSSVIDFKGRQLGNKLAPFIYASLSYDKLTRFREKFPAWKDADRFSLL